MKRIFLAAVALCLSTTAFAGVDPKCSGKFPAGYDEQTQVDFLLNYIALAGTYSAIHAPVPHNPGHGSIGVDLNVIPPLGCKRRFALGGLKTEDTNKSPILPRIRVGFAMDAGKYLVPYGSFGFAPPVPVGGQQSFAVSGELGLGIKATEDLHFGVRWHMTAMKTVADAATGFEEDDPVALDLYMATSYGVDAQAGYKIGPITPYISLGFTDVSTFFWIGDDGFVSNNLHPYLGPAFAVGADGLVVKDRLRFGAEFYGAPGGHSTPDKNAKTIKGFGHYGHLYTGRVRVALEL